ncbi:MAG: succinylglutamate desuccinylase/aspartoacylase family protein [Desulfobacterales bacterium]|nr:succinylglutamate desuccinylase/aspartoacylase family protein [Desulfobacterales bacterium]
MTVQITWGFGSSPGMLKWANRFCRYFISSFPKMFLGVIIFLCTFAGSNVNASQTSLDFSVHTLSSGQPGRTALIVGGIQGDEPGGFNAAALIATHYRILSGHVIVVPNLNFPSIVKRSRGIYGDMNRKFDRLSEADPERRTIVRIKSMIKKPDVDFILNLHDGSGFYTPTHETAMRNPRRWGQSIIIDQSLMPRESDTASGLFSNLSQAAAQCAQDMNTQLLDPSHKVRVKNTHTAKGDIEMAKTLTYFALKHDKPAFGIEASKSFLTPGRVYYHLLAIESFLTQAGIRFERGFNLTQKGIRKAIDQDIALSMGDRRILLFAENIRKRINYLPMEKDRVPQFLVNHPLLVLVPNQDHFSLFHGNRCLAKLSPQYFEYDLNLDGIDMVVDGQAKSVQFGSLVPVKERFLVKDIPDHRVNIIGFSKQNIKNESGVVVRRQQFMKRFSIDRAGKIFRIEVYSQEKFNGMVLVDFRPQDKASNLARLSVDQLKPKNTYQ